MNQIFTQMIQSQLRQNPNYAAIQELIQKAGGDPKTAFMQEAQRRGIDPQTIISQAKGMLNIK